MPYQLVVDSCCELTPELKEELHAQSAPLTLTVDGVDYIDDETMDSPSFLEAMYSSRNLPKSSCPSPESYAQRLRLGGLEQFMVTLSAKLSGSHNCAQIAAKLVSLENRQRKIHVFDSKSASAGEIAVSLKILEYARLGCSFEQIVEKVESFIHEMKTFFILENLDNLIKSGRMNRIVGYVASAMSLRPIMTSDDGAIKLHEKARGSLRAFTRLVEIIGETGSDFSDRTLVITHCQNERQAHFLQAEAKRLYNFKDIKVIPTGGLSSMYANKGGVIIAY